MSLNLVQSLDTSIESVNLIGVNAALCFIGAMLCVVVMQLSTTQGDLVGESRFGIWSRRFSFAALGIAMMWACAYSATKGWQPWPPHVFLVLVLDVVLALRAGQIVVRCNQLKNMFKVAEARRRELSLRR